MTAILRSVSLCVLATLVVTTRPFDAAEKQAARFAADARVSAGNGTLYVGGWPNRIMIIDEATEKVTGEITLKTGAPRRMELSRDRTRFYTVTTMGEDAEVIDVASRQVVDQFRLSDGRTKVRLSSLTPDPLHRFVVLLAKSSTKQVDRFEIMPAELLVYDLQAHKVTKKIGWPKGEEREGANMIMSPDGKYLYFFSDADVLVYETTDFKQVDQWELSRPIEEGLGRFDFGPRDSTWEEPGFYTGLFFQRDPVQNRDMMGIARVNLTQKSVEFYTLGPTRRVSFALAPDRKKAYGLLQEIGRYEFWTFDLEGRRVQTHGEFRGRPRMSLRPSSNGKVLYVYNAGNTIDLYEAATYKYLRTLTLDMDNTTDLFVTPPASATKPGQ